MKAQTHWKVCDGSAPELSLLIDNSIHSHQHLWPGARGTPAGSGRPGPWFTAVLTRMHRSWAQRVRL